ncbi:ankyrin repeat and SAM domain-containing protein 1A [Anabrus simplex]|uniref:ankyrin repeat and SAM domain-containing protein 1A n=1 Tax=Anabrus simplex TaxID=316456 RepID=UPI0035A2A51F
MGKDQELLEAARNGNIPVVEKILSQRAKRSGPLASLRRGPGANVQDSSGYSALHHAALNGHKEIVQLLLAHEASTNIVDVKGSSPLHLAAWTGNVDIVRLLLCHGPSVPNVNLTTKDNETALHCAAQYGHTAVVSQLLEHSCDPSIRNSREETALDLAAQYGRLETVELLVRTHPELIQPYSSRVAGGSGTLFPHTPLHLASRNGHKAVVAVLLAAGLDVNVRTAGGTALHEAALCGKVEVVRTLLDGGVDLGITDSQRNTVMDLLGQFPAHVTQDITAIIRKHRSGPGDEGDAEREGSANPLPPIPVPDPSLGSPYENVRVSSRARGTSGVDSSSPSTSPTHWEFYHNSKARSDVGEERRVSGTSALSVASDSGMYQPTHGPVMDSNFHSEDLSLYHGRDPDQMSISSTTSSTGGPSPRDRRPDASSSIYMPMAPGHSHTHGHSRSPGSNSKVSPTPPKKPPRRNLSVSPTHLQPTLMTMSADSAVVSGGGGVGGGGSSTYEYLFLARSGVRSHGDLDDLQGMAVQTLGGGRREALLRRGRSADQYVDMRARHGLLSAVDNPGEALHALLARGRSEDPDDHRKHPQQQPVAITSVYENMPVRTQNPRRKLRRHYNDRAYENYEPVNFRSSEVTSSNGGGGVGGGNKEVSSSPAVVDSSGPTSGVDNPKFVSSAYITLKSSQESLLDEKATTPTAEDKKVKKVQVMPLSPTHYQQPPTPDHPPPSAMQAEKSIHERIRPLSQEYKRRSRDIETETEEDLLLFPSLDASSGSLSSSVSLSDKSVSTDNNVEEFLGDVPFAGLFKGSTSQGAETASRSSPAERPKTLRRLKNVYDASSGTNGKVAMGAEDGGSGEDGKRASTSRASGSAGGAAVSGDSKGPSLSILSPFDEQEEWAKISEIMASFGTGLVRESVFVSELEKEFQNRLGLTHSEGSSPVVSSSVGQWLATLGLVDYESLFHNNGYDDLDFINGVLEEQDLKDMGIDNESDRATIMEASRSLPCKVQNITSTNNNNNINNNKGNGSECVNEWLRSIRLECYQETFHKHLYNDMERVRRIWEVELTAVLEIHRVGHRRRILASVNGHQHGHGPNLEDINADLNLLKSNIQQLKEEIREKLPPASTGSNTGTLRHSHKKSRPAPPPPQPSNGAATASCDLEIRGPSELLEGVPATLTTQWRHRPHVLVTGSVTYIANYLGSTVVKELRGTESTKKSIQKLKKSTKESKSTPDIVLAISYRGVKFLNTLTQELVCEHEIRNIHCACQDADDLTHFAYITKDHESKSHYCHVFCVQTMDQATEIILTLGQAFEVAYQMALREQFSSTGPRGTNGHTRSQSATQILPSLSVANHSRSHSVNEIKINGQQPPQQQQSADKSEAQTPKAGTPSSTTSQAPIVLTEEL